MVRTLLFGWYNGEREMFSKLIENKGYLVRSVGSLNEFEGKEGMVQLAENEDFDLYVMNANLGFPGLDCTDGVKKIYKVLEDKGVNNIEERLIAVSSVWDQRRLPKENFRVIGERRFYNIYLKGENLF